MPLRILYSQKPAERKGIPLLMFFTKSLLSFQSQGCRIIDEEEESELVCLGPRPADLLSIAVRTLTELLANIDACWDENP